MNSEKFLKDNFGLVSFTLASIVLNFLLQLLLARYFGTTFERDAYFVAFTIPSFFNSIYITSIVVAFLPALVNAKTINPELSNKVASGTILINAAFIFVLVIIIAWISEYIIGVVTPSYQEDQIIYTSSLLKILCVAFGFQSFNTLLGVIFNVDKKFIIPALQPVLIVLTSILSVLFFSSFGIISLAWGYLTGNVLHSIVVLVTIKKQVFSITGFWDIIKSKPLNSIFVKALPLLLSGLIVRSSSIVEKYFATSMEVGSVSYLGYATQLILALSVVTSGSIATTLYPRLAEHFSNKSNVSLSKDVTMGINTILLIVFPIMACISLVGENIIQILFQHGSFTENDTKAVATTLLYLLGYFLFISLGNVISRIYYISGFTKLIAAIGLIEMIVYLIVALYFSDSYKGLALALTISSGASIFIQIYFLKRIIGLSLLPHFIKQVLKVSISVLISVSPFILMMRSVSTQHHIITSGFVIFGVFTLFIFIAHKIFYFEEINRLLISGLRLLRSTFK